MLPPLVSRFVAGEDAEAAVTHARQLNDDGIQPILNRLGEHHNHPKEVDKTVEEYEALLDEVSHSDVNVAISLKPSQLGLDIHEALFQKRAEDLVDYAVERDVFVWFDMEKSDTIDDTLSLYEYLAEEHPGMVGICLQANMRRTQEDLNSLAELTEPSVRIVKGAYNEPRQVAYKKDEEVDSNYLDLVETALNHIDGRVAIATHDESMIEKSLKLAEDENATDDYEFQMLMGVREERQRELAKAEQVAQYAPYGSEWASYTYRRIRENPKNLLFIGKALYNSLR